MHYGSLTTRAGKAVRGFAPPVLLAPEYRRLWHSGIAYYSANAFEMVTAGWVVLSMTGSPFAVGLVGFFRMLPLLALGVVLGAIADRWPRTSVLLGIQGTGFVVAGITALLFQLGLVNLAVMCVATGIIGCIWAADFSTRRALISEVNTPELASNAMSMEAMSMHGSKIGATVVAGTLLAIANPAAAYACLAVIYLISVLTILRVRRILPSNDAPSTTRVSVLYLIRSGLSDSIRIPKVRAVLLVTVFMNLLVFPYQQLMAVIAGQILSVGPERMGVLAGIDGVGAIVVASLMVYRGRASQNGIYFVGGASAGGAIVVLLALSTIYPLSVALQLVAGGFFAGFAAMQPVLILNAVEPQMRARAMGLLAMAIGCMPLGILLSGTLSSIFGPSITIAGMASLGVSLVLLTLFRNRALIQP